MNLGLDGKVALVTGAGRGIGRAIALTLSEEGAGAAVAVNDIDGTAANAVASEIRGQGRKALAIKADVTSLEQVNRMVRQAIGEFGRLDILVNNAGIAWTEKGSITRNTFATQTPDEWDLELNITLRSTLNCSKAVIDHMISRRSGKIINIGSSAGTTGMAAMTLYGAGKAGVMGFTRALAAEVGQYGINVNCVSPGVIRATRFVEYERVAEHDSAARKKLDHYSVVTGLNCLGRPGEPEDLARMVVFLASKAADFVTGQVISVDGGFPVLRTQHYGTQEAT